MRPGSSKVMKLWLYLGTSDINKRTDAEISENEQRKRGGQGLIVGARRAEPQQSAQPAGFQSGAWRITARRETGKGHGPWMVSKG